MLVKREAEQKLVKDRVETIRRGGRVFDNIINFTGVTGIGKTTLLKELLYDNLKEDEQLCTIFVDFAAIQDRQDGYETFLNAVRQRLAPDQKLTAGEMVHMLLDRLPLVLFLDTAERVGESLAAQLETEIIEPLTATEQVVVVLAGRRPMRWRRFDVRNRVVDYEMAHFSTEETREQFADGYEYITPEVLNFSYGHPAASEEVKEKFIELGGRKGRSDDIELFRMHKDVFISTLARYLNDTVMEDVSEERIKYALKTIAPVRYFDVNMLRHILAGFGGSDFGGYSAAYYVSIARQMTNTDLVQWHTGRRGYALDDSMRRMLCLVMTFQDRARFAEINRVAADKYAEWIRTVADNRVGFILERLYHLVFVLRYESVDEVVLGETLQRELTAFIEAYCVDDGAVIPAKIDELWNLLRRDDELADLTRDIYAELVQIVEGYVEQPKEEVA